MMGSMKDLLGDEPMPERAFGGSTYLPQRDHTRLSSHLDRVFTLMSDGEWRTLEKIVALTGGTVASASARLRDFRKAQFGAHTVERRHVESGLFEYRLIA